MDWARIHHPDSRAAPYMENVHRLIVEGCNILCARGGVRACGALCERRIPCMHPLCQAGVLLDLKMFCVLWVR